MDGAWDAERVRRGWQVLCAVVTAGVLAATAMLIDAAPGRLPAGQPPPPHEAAAAPSVVDAWARLTTAQQRTLQPLQARWAVLDERTRARWVAVADHLQGKPFPVLARAMHHMAAWQHLPPGERAQARLNYRLASHLTAAQKRQRWESYQAQARARAPIAPPVAHEVTMVGPSIARSATGATTVLVTDVKPENLARGRGVDGAAAAASAPRAPLAG